MSQIVFKLNIATVTMIWFDMSFDTSGSLSKYWKFSAVSVSIVIDK